MANPNQNEPATPEDLDEASLDQIVGGAVSPDTGRRQEQIQKRDTREP